MLLLSWLLLLLSLKLSLLLLLPVIQVAHAVKGSE
jgi:hypothetical protein